MILVKRGLSPSSGTTARMLFTKTKLISPEYYPSCHPPISSRAECRPISPHPLQHRSKLKPYCLAKISNRGRQWCKIMGVMLWCCRNRMVRRWSTSKKRTRFMMSRWISKDYCLLVIRKSTMSSAFLCENFSDISIFINNQSVISSNHRQIKIILIFTTS